MFKAIITTLVLGTSTAALAAPGADLDVHARGELRFGEPAPSRPYDRPYNRPGFGRPARPSWVALSSPFQLDRRWNPIDVTSRGTFSQLRLQTTNGASRIHRVIIQFQNGERQVVDLETRLDTRNPMLNIQLEGKQRRIDRIVVVGDSRRNASIQVFAI